MIFPSFILVYSRLWFYCLFVVLFVRFPDNCLVWLLKNSSNDKNLVIQWNCEHRRFRDVNSLARLNWNRGFFLQRTSRPILPDFWYDFDAPHKNPCKNDQFCLLWAVTTRHIRLAVRIIRHLRVNGNIRQSDF